MSECIECDYWKTMYRAEHSKLLLAEDHIKHLEERQSTRPEQSAHESETDVCQRS